MVGEARVEDRPAKRHLVGGPRRNDGNFVMFALRFYERHGAREIEAPPNAGFDPWRQRAALVDDQNSSRHVSRIAFGERGRNAISLLARTLSPTSPAGLRRFEKITKRTHVAPTSPHVAESPAQDPRRIALRRDWIAVFSRWHGACLSAGRAGYLRISGDLRRWRERSAVFHRISIALAVSNSRITGRNAGCCRGADPSHSGSRATRPRQSSRACGGMRRFRGKRTAPNGSAAGVARARRNRSPKRAATSCEIESFGACRDARGACGARPVNRS